MYPHHSNCVGKQLHRIASNGLLLLLSPSPAPPQLCSPNVLQLPSEESKPAAHPALLEFPPAWLTHCSTIPIAGQAPLGRTDAVEQSDGDATGAQPPKPCVGGQ